MPRPWLFLALCAVVFILAGCQVGPEEPKQGPPSIGTSNGGGGVTPPLYKQGDGKYQPLNTGDVLRHFANNSWNNSGGGVDNPLGMVAFDVPNDSSASAWYNYVMPHRYTKLSGSTTPTILYAGPAGPGKFFWQPEQGNRVLIDNPVGAGRDPYLDWNRYIRWGLNVARDIPAEQNPVSPVTIAGPNTETDQEISISGYVDRGSGHTVPYDQEGVIRTHYWKFRMSRSFLEDDVERETLLFRLAASVGPEANTHILTLTANGYKNTLQMLHYDQGMGRVKTTEVFEVPITEIADKWTAIEITMHFRDTSKTRPGRENGYLYVKLTDMEGQWVLVEKGMFADMWRRPERRNASGQWEEVPNGNTHILQKIQPGFGLRRSIAKGRPPKIAVDWSDYYLIHRNIANYRFPTGYNPNDAGPIPDDRVDVD